MKIHFCLLWKQNGRTSKKPFKSDAAFAIMTDYLARISKFSAYELKVIEASPFQKRSSGSAFWICSNGPKSKMLSSEDLADKLKKLLNSGIKELNIIIGGPDGIPDFLIQQNIADFAWSFGPMTLPHELATVVATEQIYRAWTILKGLPYHCGH